MNVCVLFSGGKDSMLAVQFAINSGHQIKCLASFFGPNNPLFERINLQVVEMAAQCMQLPLKEFELTGGNETVLMGLHEALSTLKREYHINGIVTGESTPTQTTRIIDAICNDIGLSSQHPLTGIKQRNVLYAALKNKYKIMIVKTDGYKALLGQVLDEKTIEDNQSPAILDHAGNYAKGSVILDAPLFCKKINVTETEPVREGTIMKLLLTGIVLENK